MSFQKRATKIGLNSILSVSTVAGFMGIAWAAVSSPDQLECDWDHLSEIMSGYVVDCPETGYKGRGTVKISMPK